MKQLKTGKAPGPDGLTSEHVKFSGRSLINHIVTLFNAIIEYEYTPKVYNVGHILPVYKGHGKSKSDPSSYRGITLTSILGKLFERLILDRIELWIDKNVNFPHPFQFGFRKGTGAETAVLTVMEAICYYNERNSPVYCAFLDNEKAFDRVWLDGLFYKLYNLGITGKLWRILRSSYSSMYSCVSYAEYKSDMFHVKQGVGQGRVISAWLFTLYINELLNQLNNAGC